MIEYLEKLVEDKEYQKALDYAEQLLLNPDNKPWDLMVIYYFLSEARFETGEFYGAQVASQLAAKIAREIGAWDFFGKVTLALGVSCARLRQIDNALAAYYDYIAYLSHYREAKQLHPVVLYNIGVNLAKVGQSEEALRMLKSAEEVAAMLKDDRRAHGIRHALIDAHLRYGHVEQIPLLLARCSHYLRSNPDAPDHKKSLLWHVVLRVRYALATRRPVRARLVAGRGLRLADGWPDMGFELHILLAQMYEQIGDTRSALKEAVRARGSSIEARRFDLEYEAANMMYRLLSCNPELADDVGGSGEDMWDPPAIR